MTFFIKTAVQKFLKVFVITVVLLVPVVVFLFLKKFGSNEFALPVYYENGNPLEQCYTDDSVHHLSPKFRATYLRKAPVLVGFEGEYNNQFEYDLLNVLKKYPEIEVKKINLCCVTDETRHRVLNCELVLGEDRYIDEAELNKYVLIDSAYQIRGYFTIDDLDEINRLDMELDILLNY